jgi:hypothetical protein
MMVDYTFFQDGLLMVDGTMALATPSPTNRAIAERIGWFIGRYEPEYLCKLLGEELYNDFLESEESALWDEFRSLVADNAAKVSPIANYVYFFMVRSDQSRATINGVKKDGDDNLVSPNEKLVAAWNDMVAANRKLYVWLCKHFRKVQTEQEMLETINALGV